MCQKPAYLFDQVAGTVTVVVWMMNKLACSFERDLIPCTMRGLNGHAEMVQQRFNLPPVDVGGRWILKNRTQQCVVFVAHSGSSVRVSLSSASSLPSSAASYRLHRYFQIKAYALRWMKWLRYPLTVITPINPVLRGSVETRGDFEGNIEHQIMGSSFISSTHCGDVSALQYAIVSGLLRVPGNN